MLAKTIIESDAFLEMSITARLLYVYLNMNADDDGFVNAPKKVCRISGLSVSDIDELIEHKFLLSFPGVVVIKHWWIHNSIPKDRRKPTKYQDLLRQLRLDENKAYTFSVTDCTHPVSELYADCNQSDNKLSPQVKLSKDKRSKYKKTRGVGEENTPKVYDDSANPKLDKERLQELLEKRNEA